MQITEEQKRILNSLTCERLSSNPENLRLVEHFYNAKNGSLEHTLKDAAYAEDEENNIAYYLVKHPNGEILFYFSLKCGMLYDSLDEGEQLRQMNDLYRFLVDLEKDSASTEEDRLTINSILESIRTRKGLVKDELAKISHKKKNQLLEDLEKESSDRLKRVGRTFAGIEIVHFCANDACRALWDEYHFKQKLGAVVFWHFIVPKICEARAIVGCQYLFLFAADLTPDELLINYYETFLGFRSSAEHGTAIPLYDYACKFMFQEVSGIETRRDDFYQEFNPDEECS